jgi:DNA-binding GntR family transcriptional regulator
MSQSIVESTTDQSKSARVYEHLRRRIRELDIPPGAAIRKNEVAVECGVSRAPVSEAIARLASEGLVDVFPQNGSFVARIRPEEVQEALFLRQALEVEVVKAVTLMADGELLDRLGANIEAQARALEASRLDTAGYDQLDADFHDLIIDAFDSPRTRSVLETARAILDRPRFASVPVKDRPHETFDEHRRIYDAMRTGDPELAGSAMRVHIGAVAEAIQRKLEQIMGADDD